MNKTYLWCIVKLCAQTQCTPNWYAMQISQKPWGGFTYFGELSFKKAPLVLSNIFGHPPNMCVSCRCHNGHLVFVFLMLLCSWYDIRQKWRNWSFDGSSPWEGRKDPPGIWSCTLHTYFHWPHGHYIIVIIVIHFFLPHNNLRWKCRCNKKRRLPVPNRKPFLQPILSRPYYPFRHTCLSRIYYKDY